MSLQSATAHGGGEAPCPDSPDASETAAAPCCEGGCGSHCVLCDDLGVAGLISVPVLLGASPGRPQGCGPSAGLPDHIPEQPSRPPSPGAR